MSTAGTPINNSKRLASGYEVELVVSTIPGMLWLTGWHTSILLDGEEFYFTPFGITSSSTLSSHPATSLMRRQFTGTTKRSSKELLQCLSDHFLPGTYDLLKKNCNSFTDCALYFLCGTRLHPTFRRLDQLGVKADAYTGIVQALTFGGYAPNAQAEGFNIEDVIKSITATSWQHLSYASGVQREPVAVAVPALSDMVILEDFTEELDLVGRQRRRKRLEPLSGQELITSL